MIDRRRCVFCDRPVVYRTWDQEWVHAEGGGAYWQTCSHCGWQGSGVGIGQCPECGSTEDLKDDHCVAPLPPQKGRV